MADMNDVLHLTADEARAFASDVFAAHGVPRRDADTTARCLVRADLRGVETHGIVRMPGYLDRIERGLVDPAPELAPRRVAPAVAHLDGMNGLGFVVATRATEEAMAIAREAGTGLVGVSRSTHFGMAATYLLQAVEAGFAALVFTNASPAMPPWGGRREMLGTSPFGAAFPNPGGQPFILDMAPSVAARGKIRKALREGREIPEGYALDADGRPTTDPEKALQGVVLPIGGAKGAGLSMLMDLLCGVLTGAAFAGHVGDQYKAFDRPQNVGHFILVIRPDLFLPAGGVAERMAELVATVRANPTAEGFDEILMPGEPESRTETRRLSEGIPYRRADLEPVIERARGKGVTFPG
ncbi:Ldh family oxidoreductase [Roseitranquillus sediminis]|uniref:Ldh family oxidoreductase n=1 Tax=Roseitranquillus sediminis TaxID=2809051 RepID=UPI001D0C82E5|nr:Ldh family oxidoreductase [Roseitranquillus sediminis]MBM9592991.1 Ldh family oxidoreductase [Roseitranquillus sediminis]